MISLHIRKGFGWRTVKNHLPSVPTVSTHRVGYVMHVRGSVVLYLLHWSRTYTSAVPTSSTVVYSSSIDYLLFHARRTDLKIDASSMMRKRSRHSLDREFVWPYLCEKGIRPHSTPQYNL
jgi:hypothetical protein